MEGEGRIQATGDGTHVPQAYQGISGGDGSWNMSMKTNLST